MERLLDNDTRRRLKLIELLYAAPGWQTIKSLTKRLNCSESVLLKDITLYNDLFQTYKDLPEYSGYLQAGSLEIETSHYGIHFAFPSGLGLDFFYQFVLKTTPAFQLLELIFFDERLSVAQLADQLFFSVPTVYRLITKINQALSPFSIELRPNPCRMTGAEQQIRYFYGNYFLEAYPLLEWPFALEQLPFKKLLAALYEPYTDGLDVASYQQLTIRIAVQLTRYQQGHYCVYSDRVYQQLEGQLAQSTEKLLAFTSLLQLKADHQSLIDILGIYLIKQQVLDEEGLFESLTRFVLSLAQTLHLQVPDNYSDIADRMLIIIHLTTKFAKGPNFLLYNGRKAFVSAVSENHACVFSLCQRELIHFLKERLPNLTPWLINDLLYVLFISWPQLFIESQRPVDILIVSAKHLGHATLIKEQLSHRYGQRILPTIYTGHQLSYDILRELTFDILISDASFFFSPPQSSIWINGYPTIGDWERIERIIQTYEKQSPAPQEPLALPLED